MAAGIIYLRPSADISVKHGLYPSESSAAYLLVNEEVADDDATYIWVDGDQIAVYNWTSVFQMGGSIPTPIPQISNVRVVMRAVDPYSSKSENVADYHYATISVNGTALAEKEIASSVGSAWTDYSIDYPDAVSAINNYIEQKGDFPSIILSLRSYTNGTSTGISSSDEPIYISQIYIAIEYATGIGVHKKVNGAWVAANSAYQKQNGAWVEITEDECKSTLQNTFCTS